MDRPYDESGLQSLFGYGRAAHERSGGICQLCGCGAGPDIDFDLWRQFTIEHLIGEGQGGYPPRIRRAVDARFPHLSDAERASLAVWIREANIVTACQFCNSTTSRDRAQLTMEEIITSLPDDPEDALRAVAEKLQVILDAKRATVRWKLRSVYRGFRETIRPALLARRQEEPALQEPRDLSGLDVIDTAPVQPRPGDAG
ncbi:MAG: hypothetical protein ACRDI0_12765 [Actinomycetota bacterium]